MTTPYMLHLLSGPDGRQTGAVPLIFSSKTQAGALRQARRLWEMRPLDPDVSGYRLVQQDTGAVVYEHRMPG